MNGFLFSLALTAAGVIAITLVAVAGELRRRRRRGPVELSVTRAVHVDVDIDRLPEQTPPAHKGPDSEHRQATLDRALGRMSQTPTTTQGWIETRPMVAPAVHPDETARH